MSKPIIIGIYKITSPSGCIYIGQGTDIYSRWGDYRRLACKGQQKLYASLLKYGFEKHNFEIIHTLETRDFDKLNELEKFYIKYFDSFDTEHGMNLTDGGLNKKMSEQSKIKIGERSKRENRTEETLKRMSEAQKGKKRNTESIAKGVETYRIKRESNPQKRHTNYGKKRSIESIEKGKETVKMKKKEQILNGTYVPKVISEAQKNKISESQKGKKRNPESIERQKDTYKKNREANPNKKHHSYGKKRSQQSIQKQIETKAMIRQERLTMIF